MTFQCSSASRKFLNSPALRTRCDLHELSVLFSEPKIPQSTSPPSTAFNAAPFQCSSASRKFLNRICTTSQNAIRQSFSALQRAENSSIVGQPRGIVGHPAFSALQRAENSSIPSPAPRPTPSASTFSALQRAENSSIMSTGDTSRRAVDFQCSSASRKFLNHTFCKRALHRRLGLSVLFSEPKIPQLTRTQISSLTRTTLSVLFSEPKIPQFKYCNMSTGDTSPFSALQRAENSSIQPRVGAIPAAPRVSVLFSEPKIPQLKNVDVFIYSPSVFQCSSASRKFLNSATPTRLRLRHRVSVLFSEPKIPQ